jgi:hypothetical protein
MAVDYVLSDRTQIRLTKQKGMPSFGKKKNKIKKIGRAY